MSDYLVSTLLFMKPVYEENHDEGTVSRYIFQNECEWRYVPEISTLPHDVDFILRNEDVTRNAISYYSDVLENHQESWLFFDWDEIKYIIVPSEKESEEMIKVIRTLDIDSSMEDLLISKLEV